MEKSFEELAYSKTERGELILRRRKVPMLENQVVHEVLLNGEFLMSSLFHAAEDALARLGIAEVAADEGLFDIVVGGLGLGYTAAAALDCANVGSVRVIEIFSEVIGWHKRGLVPLGNRLAHDSNCQLEQGDFFAMVNGCGFDPAAPNRRFHAVLLDIDHTPEHWLHPEHAHFYSEVGLRSILRHLHPGGVFAMWADGRPSAAFTERLNRVFQTARAEIIAFPNPIRGDKSHGTVYLATVGCPC